MATVVSVVVPQDADYTASVIEIFDARSPDSMALRTIVKPGHSQTFSASATGQIEVCHQPIPSTEIIIGCAR